MKQGRKKSRQKLRKHAIENERKKNTRPEQYSNRKKQVEFLTLEIQEKVEKAKMTENEK